MLQQHDKMEGTASAIESLQHEVERLQHLEQRRAQLQSASTGTCLLQCRIVYLPMHTRVGSRALVRNSNTLVLQIAMMCICAASI